MQFCHGLRPCRRNVGVSNRPVVLTRGLFDSFTIPSPPPVPAPAPTEQATVISSSPSSPSPSPYLFQPPVSAPELREGIRWTYNEFVKAVEKDEIQTVYLQKDLKAKFITKTEEIGFVQLFGTESLLERFLKHNVEVQYVSSIQSSNEQTKELAKEALSVLLQIIGFYIVFQIIFFLFSRSGGMGGGSNSPFSFSQKIGKEYNVETDIKVSFQDVAGIDNAKEDLAQVVDFLNNTESYTRLGARIPKGVLLIGPPGTGKTLLARAVAGEAKVPFFSCSASEFIEMFVGVGASRIRELFKKAKEKAPCIIFIDEIDAVGRKRSGNMGASNDERDQTINQLLTEMDGFTGNQGIIILAATNRPELLDDALTRAGRFDRRVMVELPNNAGREEILRLYLQGKQKPIAEDVSIEKIAKMTTGFSGAELENLCNETAIFAARSKKDRITQEMFEITLDKLTLGAETKNNLITQNKKEILAYHEAGHTLLGMLMGDFDTFRKVSIVARGNAGGITFFEPNEERVDMGLYSREYLENQLVVFMGGRVAEEIRFGSMKATTGAVNDIEQATNLAQSMISQFGFNETIGPVCINDEIANSLGQDVGGEVKYMIENAYQKAHELLQTHEGFLIKIANELMEKETLDKDDICRILEGISCEQCLEETEKGTGTGTGAHAELDMVDTLLEDL